MELLIAIQRRLVVYRYETTGTYCRYLGNKTGSLATNQHIGDPITVCWLATVHIPIIGMFRFRKCLCRDRGLITK